MSSYIRNINRALVPGRPQKRRRVNINLDVADDCDVSVTVGRLTDVPSFKADSYKDEDAVAVALKTALDTAVFDTASIPSQVMKLSLVKTHEVHVTSVKVAAADSVDPQVLGDVLRAVEDAASELAVWKQRAKEALAYWQSMEAAILPIRNKDAEIRIMRKFIYTRDRARRLSDLRLAQWQNGTHLPFVLRMQIGAEQNVRCLGAINTVAAAWWFLGTREHQQLGLEPPEIFKGASCMICLESFEQPGWVRLLTCCTTGVC